MNKKILYSVLAFYCFLIAFSQTNFPGGVPGAEAWYIVNHNDVSSGLFRNSAEIDVRIQACPDNAMPLSLFNFNHSVNTQHLCIFYNAPLENTTSRNVFFVGEPLLSQTNYSHLTTYWRQGIPGLAPTDTIINRFDVANKNVYVNTKKVSFQSVNNANVNFYNWNIYQTEKKIKSYGKEGETSFYIGKGITTSTPNADYFSGNFPEFISFPFELTYNQKNRVESYLALKYGITLAPNTPYHNSRNVVFWNTANYSLFGARIFGIGRDDVSALNQLESESVHNRDYLIASVGELSPTNQIKQGLVSIDRDNFIVFGDNGQNDGLDPLNAANVRKHKRKWLSQSTGDNALLIPMYFKYKIQGAILQALVTDSTLKLWMLHDKYVTNQSASNFTSQYVDYYEPSAMDGLSYGFFNDVFFDTDKGIYDQFTFGVGPKLIVQVRFELGDCDDQNINSSVVITGGRAPYHITIQNSSGYNAVFNTNNNIFPFTAVAPNTYTVTVTDSQSNTASTSLNVTLPQIPVNLGNDVVLNASLQQVTFNASANVLDPTATYEWYKDGVSLQVYTPALTVSEPGEYSVTVTSGNRMCQESDSVMVYYHFAAVVHPEVECDDTEGTVSISLSGGIPPFTTSLSGDTQTISQVHNTELYTFQGVPFGNYTLTSIDANGEMFQENIELLDPLEGIEIDLAGLIAQYCTSNIGFIGQYPIFDTCSSSLIVDVSQTISNPNVSFEWYLNGVLTDINSPEVEVYADTSNTVLNEYQLVVNNLETGCSASEIIILARHLLIREPDPEFMAKPAKNKVTKEEPHAIAAKVYPNPSKSGTTFYYEITSDKAFNGTVDVYSPTGALLHSSDISGQSTYKIPFSLIAAGTYLITTRTAETTLTNKVIIK